MKRLIGSIAAVVLAMSLGVSAYAKTSPKGNAGTKTAASAPKVSKHKNRKQLKHRRTSKHRMHSKSKVNNKTQK